MQSSCRKLKLLISTRSQFCTLQHNVFSLTHYFASLVSGRAAGRNTGYTFPGPWKLVDRSIPISWKVPRNRSCSQVIGERVDPSYQGGGEVMATEESVGILCHANLIPGFRGVLKQRYSDFIVNEVDCSGNVIHLTRLENQFEISFSEAYAGSSLSFQKKDENIRAPMATVADCKLDNSRGADFGADVEAFKALAGESNAEHLKRLLSKIAEGEGSSLSPVLLAPDADKAHRAAVHNFFKGRLSFFVTDTVDGPSSNEKCVRLRYNEGKPAEGGDRGGRFSKRGRDSRSKLGDDSKRQKPNGPYQDRSQPFDSRGVDDWPTDRPKFLQFHLFKENKDTQDAVTVISRMLHVQPKSFGFAGTKDKRAVTTQRVTVFKQQAVKMAALNSRLFGIKVGNFGYVDKGLVLGQLSGNRFTVTLRGVVAESDEAIGVAAEGLGRSGFINYFGLQRFGSGAVGTHAVGAALLRGEWKVAANLILQPREGEQSDVKDARDYYLKTQDADGALLRMPRYLTGERALLVSLKRDATNYLQAINCIPRTLRMMYVHSYQSFLWNHAASHRVKTYGVEKVVEGDLVYCGDGETNEPVTGVPKPGNVENIPASGALEAHESVTIDEVVHADVAAEGPCKIKCVTADDIASKKYQIWDVLLPLPGSSTLYPANDTRNVYYDLANKDSVDLNTCTHNVKEYAITQLPGGYRRLLQKPIDSEWKVMKYDDVTKPLAETDLDKLLSLKLASVNGTSTGKDSTEDGGKEMPLKIGGGGLTPADLALDVAIPAEVKSGNGAVKTHEGGSILGSGELGAMGSGDVGGNGDMEMKLEHLSSNSKGAHTAVQLSFTLPASCYATMAIREVLKMSTAVAFHKTLNDEPTK